MLRRVVVCLDDRPSGRMSLDAALRFAVGYGATLTGLVIREPPTVPGAMTVDVFSPGAVSPGTAVAIDRMLREHEETENAREQRLVHTFREACLARGLGCAWRECSGDPRLEIPRAVRACDLVIIGRGEKPDDALGSVASTLVRQLACPVMVVSREIESVTTLGVCYDGSHGADRALALAADVASHWKGTDVAVVLIGVRTGDDSVREALNDAERYLDAYHLAHRTHLLDGPPAELLVETALREKVDLLLMGAYGHSRARELLLGSTTRQVIDRWKGALLLWR